MCAPYADAEEHPSGKQHIFLSACSCFSFEAVPRQHKSMASIHHPNVPLWFFHLQRAMNRLYPPHTPSHPHPHPHQHTLSQTQKLLYSLTFD